MKFLITKDNDFSTINQSSDYFVESTGSAKKFEKDKYYMFSQDVNQVSGTETFTITKSEVLTQSSPIINNVVYQYNISISLHKNVSTILSKPTISVNGVIYHIEEINFDDVIINHKEISNVHKNIEINIPDEIEGTVKFSWKVVV